MDRRTPRPGTPRAGRLLVAVVAVAAGACGNEEPPPPDLAAPSSACDEAFVTAAEAGERPAPESPRSPDLDALVETLDACSGSDEWLTAVRNHPGALPLELDRETALDSLCAGNEDRPVCADWGGSPEGPTD